LISFIEKKFPVLSREIQSIDSNHNSFIDNVNFKNKNEFSSENMATKNVNRVKKKLKNQYNGEIGRFLFISNRIRNFIRYYLLLSKINISKAKNPLFI
jgi:hypothetical protein